MKSEEKQIFDDFKRKAHKLFGWVSGDMGEYDEAVRELFDCARKQPVKVDPCIPPTTNEQSLEKIDKLRKFCDTLSACTGLPNWTNVHTREMLAVVLTEKKFEGDPDENN